MPHGRSCGFLEYSSSRFGLNLDRTLLDHGAFQGAVAMAEETRAVQGALF